MKKILSIIFTVMVVFLFAACGGTDNGSEDGPDNADAGEEAEVELTISAAASLTDALEVIREKYAEIKPEVTLTFNMGPSGQLQQQIEQGAPADVFISAAQGQMNALEEKGLIITETRADILLNELVLIVPLDSTIVESFDDLQKEEVQHIGIGSPESVPAGQYAKEVLENIDLWDELSPKFVEGQNVRTVLSYVETGNAEAGFVYSSDTVVSDKVKIVSSAPTGSASPILYPTAVVEATPHVEAAKNFVEFLQSETVIKILEEFGFSRLE